MKLQQKLKTDLKKRAYLFALKLIKFIRLPDLKEPVVPVIVNQLIDNNTSIGSNFIEAL